MSLWAMLRAVSIRAFLGYCKGNITGCSLANSVSKILALSRKNYSNGVLYY